MNLGRGGVYNIWYVLAKNVNVNKNKEEMNVMKNYGR
jgi:hypothetical protein